ncbi:hypothetical protein JZ751_022692 [Albula glossodonta]|uniref:Uncharacterized protein n=1 Tax=Albula glossodonta TaxID=121402 RepID=A0A8T2PM96_9TELE|nr:hypothetical protein JZ751_022692 [Albula glossodonta]
MGVSTDRPNQVLHQHRGENANTPVELALPEAIVLMVVFVENLNDGTLWEGQLVVCLALVNLPPASPFMLPEASSGSVELLEV